MGNTETREIAKLRWVVEGDCNCKSPQEAATQPTCIHRLMCQWGQIKDPVRPENDDEIRHLMLTTRDYVDELIAKGPREIYGGGWFYSASADGDRLFAQIERGDSRWVWELFDAHWWDGYENPGISLMVGKWPD